MSQQALISLITDTLGKPFLQRVRLRSALNPWTFAVELEITPEHRKLVIRRPEHLPEILEELRGVLKARAYVSMFEREWYEAKEAFERGETLYTSAYKCHTCKGVEFEAKRNGRDCPHCRKMRKRGASLYRRLSVECQTPAWADKKAIRQLELNRPEGQHIDHIIPIRGRMVTGLHVHFNMQYMDADKNIRKSNRVDLDEITAGYEAWLIANGLMRQQKSLPMA
ncbi:hypothetical protein ZL54_22505 [Salmonella enterica subsp. enterica]|nr:hypothetical protein [Salmonella enterica subsp. enterica]EEJ7209110.1 hypothetical protein [Salmonella enterica subsp. enterica]